MQLISKTEGSKHRGRIFPQAASSLAGSSCGQGCKTAVGLLQRGEGSVEMLVEETECSPDWVVMNFTVGEKLGLKCEIKGKAKFGKYF